MITFDITLEDLNVHAVFSMINGDWDIVLVNNFKETTCKLTATQPQFTQLLFLISLNDNTVDWSSELVNKMYSGMDQLLLLVPADLRPIP